MFFIGRHRLIFFNSYYETLVNQAIFPWLFPDWSRVIMWPGYWPLTDWKCHRGAPLLPLPAPNSKLDMICNVHQHSTSLPTWNCSKVIYFLADLNVSPAVDYFQVIQTLDNSLSLVKSNHVTCPLIPSHCVSKNVKLFYWQETVW